VAVGTEFCGAESDAVRDPTFWTVTIGMFKYDRGKLPTKSKVLILPYQPNCGFQCINFSVCAPKQKNITTV